MPGTAERLRAAIAAKTATVGVIGLGYVGLPLARAFTGAGYRVLGFDIDPARVSALNTGTSYLRQTPDVAVAEMRAAGFEATDRFDRLGEADAVLVCVPTPLTDTREPDLTHVVNAAGAVAGRLRRGQLVVLESTTYPGTTRSVVLPALERTGLAAGADFFLAFSPEREDPGNPTHTVSNIPKVVGGLDPASTDAACALYSAIVPQVVRVSSPEVAEACKILENTYRAVNIALVNELKVLYDRMGIDVWEVIDAARTKPFGFQAFYPGPGLGGACIPVSPRYLAWAARRAGSPAGLVERACEVNAAVPGYVVGRVAGALRERGVAVAGSRIALLGMAYKRDVDDLRESPGLALLHLLLEEGAHVSYNDPHVPSLPRTRRPPHPAMDSTPLTAGYLSAQDCVVIATDHTAYDYRFIVAHARLVVDTRNATRDVPDGRGKIVRA